VTLVALIDYRVGNIFSMKKALEKTGLIVNVTSDSNEILEAQGIVLPGVGNFGAASDNIRPFKEAIIQSINSDTPLLGSCLGMQLLFEWSEEAPGKGLSVLEGSVVKFPENVKTPHMGWNTLDITRQNELLDGINEGTYFYFVHSYYVNPKDPTITASKTRHSLDFTSMVANGSIYGTQFHPEKSGNPGAILLENFAKTMRR
jgi:glutamine amidotransferase